MKEIVKKWLDRVEYDIQTAEAMLDAGRTIYAVFMCQQALEKCFKALIEYRGEEPYPIHNLRRLSTLCKARFDELEALECHGRSPCLFGTISW